MTAQAEEIFADISALELLDMPIIKELDKIISPLLAAHRKFTGGAIT